MKYEHISKEFLEKELKTKQVKTIYMENNISRNGIYSLMKKFNLKTPKTYEREKERIVVVGQKFGRWKILGDVESIEVNSKTRLMVKCECECGTIKDVNYRTILKGNSKSCGCLSVEKLRIKGYKDISGSYFRRVRDGAISRLMSFDITIKDVWDIYESQNRKCALSGIDIVFWPNINEATENQTASIDRIDNSKGYTKDNIQIVHKRANNIKHNMTEEELKYWVYHMYHNLKPSAIYDGVFTRTTNSKG